MFGRRQLVNNLAQVCPLGEKTQNLEVILENSLTSGNLWVLGLGGKGSEKKQKKEAKNWRITKRVEAENRKEYKKK